jgi:hypothetical protein
MAGTPAAHRAEIFEWGAYVYDIARAKAEAEARPHERVMLPVASWATMLGMMRIDPDHVPTRPLDEPVLLVRLGGPDGPAMVIDGWHRIAKAQAAGIETLPAVLLDAAAEAAARLR